MSGKPLPATPSASAPATATTATATATSGAHSSRSDPTMEWSVRIGDGVRVEDHQPFSPSPSSPGSPAHAYQPFSVGVRRSPLVVLREPGPHRVNGLRPLRHKDLGGRVSPAGPGLAPPAPLTRNASDKLLQGTHSFRHTSFVPVMMEEDESLSPLPEVSGRSPSSNLTIGLQHRPLDTLGVHSALGSRSSSPNLQPRHLRGGAGGGSSGSSSMGSWGGGDLLLCPSPTSDVSSPPLTSSQCISRLGSRRSSSPRLSCSGFGRVLASMPADTIVQFYEFTEIVRDLGATLTSVAFLGQVAERQISRLLQSKYCRLFVLDAASKELMWIVDGAVRRGPMAVNLCGFSISSGKSIYCESVSEDPRYSASVDDISVEEGDCTRDLYIIPLRDSGTSDRQVLGTLALGNRRQGGVYTSEEKKMLQEACTCLSRALSNILSRQRLEADLRHTRIAESRAKILLRFAKAVTTQLDTESLIECILENGKELMQCDRCSLFLVDMETEELVSYFADGFSQLRMPLDDGIAGLVAKTGAVLNISDAYSDERFSKRMDKLTGYKTRNLLCMPIRSHGEIIGVVQMINKHGDCFDQDDEYFCGLVSIFCGISLHNALLFERSMHESRKSALVLELIRSLSSTMDFDKLLEEIAERTRELAGAERCSVFVLDEKTNSLVSRVQQGTQEIRVQMGEGIAGYVAERGEMLCIENPYEDPRFNFSIDQARKFVTRNLLCMPIVVDGRTLGVTQIINKIKGSFGREDEGLLAAFSSFCGITLHNASLYKRSMEARDKTRALLNVALALTEGGSDNAVIADIMEEARYLIGAERCSLFLVDTETRTLRTKMAYGTDEICIPLHSGIAGHVVRTGEVVACEDPYRHPNFLCAVDAERKFKTANILAVPVRDTSQKIIGVAEVMNKLGSTPRAGGTPRHQSFTKEDSQILKAFAAFCGKAVSMQPMLSLVNQSEVFEQMSSLDQDDLRRVNSWDFAVWDFPDSKLICVAEEIFVGLGLLDRFKIPRQSLVHFLFTIRRHYQRHVPYHNFRHAVDATQFLYRMLMVGNMAQHLSEVDLLALVVGSLCHDLNHQGYNNVFMASTQTPFSLLTTESIMESHHAALAVAILTSPECNILVGLKKDEQGVFWQSLITLILATDMAKHGAWLKEFDRLALDPSSYDKDDPDSRRLLLSMLMKLADISNISRPTYLAHKWADILLVEFFNQGDQERKLGLVQTPIFDREKTSLAALQAGFISGVGVPAFAKMAAFCSDLHCLEEQLLENLNYWKRLQAEEEGKEETLSPATPSSPSNNGSTSASGGTR